MRTFADVAGAPRKREKQLSAQLAQLQEKLDKLVSSQAPAALAKVEADVDIQQLVKEHQSFLRKHGEDDPVTKAVGAKLEQARADRDAAKPARGAGADPGGGPARGPRARGPA